MDRSIEIDYHGHLINDDTQSLIIISDVSYITYKWYTTVCITATSQSSDSEDDRHHDDKIGYKRCMTTIFPDNFLIIPTFPCRFINFLSYWKICESEQKICAFRKLYIITIKSEMVGNSEVRGLTLLLQW